MGSCNHEWSLVSHDVLPSPFEQVVSGKSSLIGKTDMPMWVFVKTVVTIMLCKKCGQISKTVVTQNFMEGG